MKCIALVDSVWTGHHPTYFKLFAKTLLELGYEVMAFCPEPGELSEWIARHAGDLVAQLHTFKLSEPEASRFPISRFRVTLSALARWRYVRDAIEKASSQLKKEPDLVFFAYIDSYWGYFITHHLVDFIFHYRWSGLYFRPRHLRLKYRFLSLRRCFLYLDAILKSPRCCSVGVLDEGIAHKLQDKIGNKPVIVFPDIADESPPDKNFTIAQQIRNKAGNRKIIGLLGFLQKTKGILTLLEVSQKAVEEEWFFVFAGQLAERSFLPQELMRIQTLVSQNPPNCFFHFERIPDEPQVNSLISECDVLFAAYENFPHSSNILTKAAIFKKPVIVSKNFCMAERNDKFVLGISIQEGDVFGCLEALRLLGNRLEGKAPHQVYGFEEYKQFHSPEKLRLSFKAILDTARLCNSEA
ncbi:MAG: glycosyltransferase family 1 protein [Oscillatoria princeps RMCB-10]|jgi:hypothetical protein|nr:glycosyltransferase family 1 protein [Oscillatoria princeps RMCB-10]